MTAEGVLKWAADDNEDAIGVGVKDPEMRIPLT
jgi:hypothetical protein